MRTSASKHFAWLFLCFTACLHISDKQELEQFITNSDNGYKKTFDAKGLKISLTYRPTDLLVLQELGLNDFRNDPLIEAARQKYDQYYYFILSISVNNHDLSDLPELTQSNFLETVSYRMHDVSYLTTAPADTVPLADFMYQRSFGITSSTDIMLAFERAQCVETDSVFVHIKEFGLGCGDQTFSFQKSLLDNIPVSY
jgi:hypothetical protein